MPSETALRIARPVTDTSRRHRPDVVDPNALLLSANELAKELRVSTRTIRRLDRISTSTWIAICPAQTVFPGQKHPGLGPA